MKDLLWAGVPLGSWSLIEKQAEQALNFDPRLSNISSSSLFQFLLQAPALAFLDDEL